MTTVSVDGSAVREIAAIAPIPVKVSDIYRKKILTVGQEQTEYDNPNEPEPVMLNVSTLQSIVDYIKGGLAGDGVTPVIQVNGPTQVTIVSPVHGDQRQQFIFAVALPTLPAQQFDRYLELESFNIWLQSGFAATDDREAVLRQVGNLNQGLANTINDDGITQTVATRKGITRSNTEEIKNPVYLAPYRTFSEIEQPVSAFIFRIKQVNSSNDELTAHACLILADGGAWRTKAVTDIGAWLKANLEENTIVLA